MECRAFPCEEAYSCAWIYILQLVRFVHRAEGGFTASDTVGLVVEYAPATGETRVRFPDGVVQTTKDTSKLFAGWLFFVFPFDSLKSLAARGAADLIKCLVGCRLPLLNKAYLSLAWASPHITVPLL